MRALRANCVVIDTSILPKRPCISEIKDFLDNELQIDMSQVKSIQPHNVKNVVYLGMQTNEAASRIASAHHLKRFMINDGKKILIPIYVESSAVDVRVHDLPDDMDNVAIIDHMRQYGEVIAIHSELWKGYFPGFSNGVRVVKMKLALPIPSFITVDGETTLVSYQNQVKTCRNCGRKSHPKQRCSEAAAANESEANTRSSGTKTTVTGGSDNGDKNNGNINTDNQQPNAVNCNQWPALPKPKPSAQKQQNKTEMKRQRSVDSDTPNNEPKKLNPNDSNESDSSLISVSSDICPYTQRPYNLPDVSHIADPEERRALIEEDKRRINAAYLELIMQKKKKKNVS